MHVEARTSHTRAFLRCNMLGSGRSFLSTLAAISSVIMHTSACNGFVASCSEQLSRGGLLHAHVMYVHPCLNTCPTVAFPWGACLMRALRLFRLRSSPSHNQLMPFPSCTMLFTSPLRTAPLPPPQSGGSTPAKHSPSGGRHSGSTTPRGGNAQLSTGAEVYRALMSGYHRRLRKPAPMPSNDRGGYREYWVIA